MYIILVTLMYVLIHYCHIFLNVQIVSDSASQIPSCWFLCPFDMFPSLFEQFLTSGTVRCSSCNLNFASPSHFSKELWILLVGNGIQKKINLVLLKSKEFEGCRKIGGRLLRALKVRPNSLFLLCQLREPTIRSQEQRSDIARKIQQERGRQGDILEGPCPPDMFVYIERRLTVLSLWRQSEQ